MENIAVNIVTTLLVSAASAWLGAQLALRRFRSEKWWERKAEEYLRVIEALHHRKALLSEYFDEVELHKKIPPERKTEVDRLIHDTRLAIERATDIGALLFSDKASNRLLVYRKEIGKAERSAHHYDTMRAEWDATDLCLSDLIQAAQKDLHQKWPNWLDR